MTDAGYVLEVRLRSPRLFAAAVGTIYLLSLGRVSLERAVDLLLPWFLASREVPPA